MSASENLLWAHVSEEQTVELCDTVGKQEVQTKLLQYLELDVNLTRERQEILGNHLFYAFAYAKANLKSSGEISTYLSVIKEIFEHDVDTGYKSMEESFDLFKKLLLLHSVDRSPHSIKVFERDSVLGLIDNMTDTYYRHFRMYQYIFGKRETLLMQQHVLFDVEQVPDLPPLAEGVLLRDENDYSDAEQDEEEEAAGADGDADADEDENADDIDEEVAAAAGPEEGRKAKMRAARKMLQTLKSKIAEVRHYRVAPGKESIRVLKATLYFLQYKRPQFHEGKKVSWDRLRMLLDDQFFGLLQNVDVTAVVKRPRYASLKRISKLVRGLDVGSVAEKSVAVAAVLDWLYAAIALKKTAAAAAAAAAVAEAEAKAAAASAEGGAE